MDDSLQHNPQQEAPVYQARFMDDDPDVIYDVGGVPVNTDNPPADESSCIPPLREAISPDQPQPILSCPRCGGKILENENFCHTCGLPRPVQPQFCPQCGAAMPQGYQFCGQCGYQAHPQIPEEKNPGLGLGIAGMIVAIHGLALSWFPILGLIICIPGLIMSNSARKKGCRGQAKAGIICSSIGLGIQLLFLLIILIPMLATRPVISVSVP